jgi:hypothetical protein
MLANYPETLLYDNSLVEKAKNDEIPPIIGCFIADKDGKTLLTFEIFHGALESYLKKPNEELFDLELITMFLSAFERFSEQINFESTSGFNLNANNLKMHSFFCFDKFTITFFVNPRINMSLFEKTMKNYFNCFFEENKNIFENFYLNGSVSLISSFEREGAHWLNKLNRNLLVLK